MLSMATTQHGQNGRTVRPIVLGIQIDIDIVIILHLVMEEKIVVSLELIH
jgi:hypothetical protein